MIHEIALPGCTPTPLASYLKALAVLRLIGEAPAERGGDPDAAGFWRDDVFILRTRLAADELRRFFLEHYRPTPLIAPWNGGSGFYRQEGKLKEKDPITGKKKKTGVRNQETEATKTVAAIADSESPRFSDYRVAISVARQVIAEFGIVEAPSKTLHNNQKDRFIKAFRNLAPDCALSAMDCSVIIAGEEASFPRLLGTGGNDGNLDFTNNFMQRLLDVIDVSANRPVQGAGESLGCALFATPSNTFSSGAIGQFAPGAAGGPNATSGFEGNASINPWDFILMLEGATLFAASAVRRLESNDASVLSMPFTVYGRLGNVGATIAGDDKESRDEIWMPIWKAPSSLIEVSCLLAEGRVALNGRNARDGLDFARAVAQLGVNRGIESFQRYGFLKRQGKNYLATPLSRVAVHRNPDADLINELERRNWLGSVQRYARDENSPNAFRSAARELDTALFALTQQASCVTLQAVLRQVGRINAALSVSAKSQEFVRSPAPRLSVAWAIKADDGSSEYRIAVALAGLRLRASNGRTMLHTRRHLAGIGEPVNKEGDCAWEPTSRLAVWGTGPLTNNLTRLIRRRRLDAITIGAEGEVLASQTGATRDDVVAFLNGSTVDSRIAELLAGLTCVDLRDTDPPRGKLDSSLPLAFALLKIFFTSESVLRFLGWLPADRALRLPAEIPARLATDDAKAAILLAWSRLRALGVKLPGRQPPKVVADGRRWLAALCIPLTIAETRRLLRDLDLIPEPGAGAPAETIP